MYTARAVYIRALGENSSDVVRCEYNSAILMAELGRNDEAIAAYNKCIASNRRVMLAADRKKEDDVLHNVAIIYSNTDRPDEAVKVWEQVLALRITREGKNHPSVGDAYVYIADIYSSTKNWNKAIEYYEHCLQVRKVAFGETMLLTVAMAA